MLFGFTVNLVIGQIPSLVIGTEEGWFKLGESSASFKKETESIIVMGKDEFAAIKLRVSDAPISIERLQVFFEGGKVQDIEVKQPLKPGEETSVFSLEADKKEISKVVYLYKTVDNDGGQTADVELYGYKGRTDGDHASRSYGADEKPVLPGVEGKGDRKPGDDSVSTGEELHQGVNEGGVKIEEGASELKEETSLKSEIKDRKLKDKVGPGGQDMFIDDNSNYYYIDDRGNRIYVSVLDLRDKEN